MGINIRNLIGYTLLNWRFWAVFPVWLPVMLLVVGTALTRKLGDLLDDWTNTSSWNWFEVMMSWVAKGRKEV